MPDDVIIELAPNQQQASSPFIQNNNGNYRSLTSITDLLENKVAKMLGVLACGWALLVLVQGGMVASLETKDCGFVTLLFFLVFFRCWRHYCPEAYRSFTDATQSLSADYLSIPNDIQQLAQQSALPSCYIHRLFYCSNLVFAMTSVVISVMRLASQDFGKKEVENKESRDFALKVFYGLTLAEALVLLFAEALSFPIRWNSVELAYGSGGDLESGPITRGNSADGLITGGNSVGPADGPGDGPDDGPGNGPGDRPEDNGPEDRPANGPENGPGGEPEDGSENGPRDGSGDVLVNQSNECNSEAQMDRPANESNDFNLEGPANSLYNVRQRRRELAREAVTSVLVKLADILREKVGVVQAVRGQIEQVQKELRLIQALLRDADSKRNTNDLVTEWLNQVRDIANRITTVIDTFRDKIEENHAESSNWVIKITKTVKRNYKTYKLGLHDELEKIIEELYRLYQRRTDLRIEDLGAMDDVDD